MQWNVAITIRSFNTKGEAFKKLSAATRVMSINTSGGHLNELSLCKTLQDVDIAITGTEKYTQKVIEAAPRLKIISRVGIGLDSIDLPAAHERGIKILNTPVSTVQPVAEHTLALLFAVLKHIPDYNNQVHNGDFSVGSNSLLSGKRIGIIGLGRIGTKVASFLEILGCTISYYDPYVLPTDRKDWTQVSSVKDLVAQSDILTIHSAAQQGNASLIDEEVLSGITSGIILINTARGSLIDETAFIAGLKDGRIRAAGIDVFPREPYDGPLLSFPQVIATPHVASNTQESRQQMEMEAVDNILEQIKGMRR
jgi:D-3-phosphoglycerate dehydrogenase / 2-oxoglutarate reductase